MRHRYFSLGLLILLVVIGGCKTGFNKTRRPAESANPPECSVSENANLSENGEEVFQLIADLTCGDATYNGNLMGQSLGYGNQIDDTESGRAYSQLVTAFTTQTQHTPAVIDIDYEHDKQFTDAELQAANDQLIKHWKSGGLVTVSWSPLNPWSDDATLDYTDEVDLTQLSNDASDIYSTWLGKLDRVAKALEYLEQNNVTVLWRPLPEMNDADVWWGIDASAGTTTTGTTSATKYTALWNFIYDYLSETKQLSNLIWVYSPIDSASTVSSNAKSSSWALPQSKYYDVVAPVVRNDNLEFKDYETLLDLTKPLALAEYRPSASWFNDINTKFDSTLYSDRLKSSYPFVSYWVNSYSYSANDRDINLALIHMTNVSALVKRNHVLSLERAKDNKLLEARD